MMYFKIVPGKIIESNSISLEDFDEQEIKFYKWKYKLSKLKNSLKRYGLIKSIKRQKWTKEYNKYHDELRRKYLN